MVTIKAVKAAQAAAVQQLLSGHIASKRRVTVAQVAGISVVIQSGTRFACGFSSANNHLFIVIKA